MTERQRRLKQAARAEGQRLRIVHLLEELGDVDEKEQCEQCGRWFVSVSSHKTHCDGPTS